MSTTSGSPPVSGRLGTAHILFLIVAAAAPLSAMVGTVPLAFAFGDGAGVPAAFLFAGVTLLCFSAGYAVSARRTGGSGGFYASVADGLGRPPAVAAGYMALLAYNCATIGLAGALGYFTQLVLAAHGLTVSWEWCAAVGLVLTAVLGYREIALSARVLALLMLGEIGVLAALDVAILVRHGVHALPAASFSPHTAAGPGVGVSLMFAFVSFIGFESAALYGKEARNPERSVPRATYAAAALIAGFYALTSWLAVGAIGPDQVREVAGKQMGDLFFGLGDDFLGTAGSTILQVLLCTSLFAATLALHSAANRYAQVLAQDGLLPRTLAAEHQRHGSPHRASVWQSVLTALVLAGFAVAGLDPYADLTTSMLGLGTLGIVTLQALAALSVLGLRLRAGHGHWWKETLAPLLGFAGLATSVWLVVGNFDMLTGSPSKVIAALPWLLPLVALGGLLYAVRLRSAHPLRYRELGTRHTAAPATPDLSPTPSGDRHARSQ
ncbi:APC family permease [Streptomyces griseofuscus]|uniref:APC family permease n=1 Tax=Streptomyces TaxID=1883 RepID=UPI00081D6D5C|nr:MULTISPECIES: APC family permease [unclassified Streptomyces]MYQ95700.1 amino acid permease [Streptomyces sp. SID4946]SCF78530.1 amino acid/polyamine/organocation transporter, APC superfamily [Streptomyces sp. LamerLS-31b]SCF97081.1 amino acid/polyamine/organocation transporter, APC superfamily [Streptomyces sp. DconLS]